MDNMVLQSLRYTGGDFMFLYQFVRCRPWHWIFKVKYGICYISAKNGPVATKRKVNLSNEPMVSNVTIRFDLGHDLNLEFSW